MDAKYIGREDTQANTFRIGSNVVLIRDQWEIREWQGIAFLTDVNPQVDVEGKLAPTDIEGELQELSTIYMRIELKFTTFVSKCDG